MADVVEIVLAIQQLRQFLSGMDKAEKSVKDVGDEGEKAGRKMKVGWKGVAKFAGGMTALYGATKFVKGSITATTNLAKSSMALSRTTGMDVQQSSRWAAVTQLRGVQTKQFQMGLVKLSKEMEKTRLKGGKGTTALEQLGFAQKDAAIQSGNTEEVLMRVSDALAATESPAKKAAIAQQLFSRSGIALAPMLYKGSAALQDQLDLADKYGVTLSTKTSKGALDLIKRQRELKLAQLGVQVQLGTALMPTMLAFSSVIVDLTRFLQPLLTNATAMKIVIGLLTIAFIAWKIATIAATIAQWGLNISVFALIGIVLLVIVAIALLAVGFYYLYTRVGWFRKGVQATWKWIKTNWPLLLAILLGPFALAAYLIIRNLDKIKAGAAAIASAFTSAFGAAKEAGKSAINFLIRGWNRLQFSVPGFKKGPVKFGGFKLGVPKIAELAAGGTIMRSGSALVGERGPEIVALPRGAQVQPLTRQAELAGVAGMGRAEITTRVFLDRREIAKAVGEYTADQVARR